MTTYTLPENGTYEFDPAYDYPHYALVATGSGTVTVEYRHPGSDVWRMVPETLDASDENIVRFAGIVDQFRFVLTESTGGAVVTARTQDVTAFDTNLLSGPVGYQRLRVDVGEPGFWNGRQFAFEQEIDLENGETIVYRFDLPVDVMLLESRVTCDDGTLYYRVYRDDQITETGAFATEIDAYPLNVMSFAPSYARQTTAWTDGASASGGITIDDDSPYPTARLRTSGATAQSFNVGAAAGLMRGFPPTSAYAVITQLPGSNRATSGVLTLRFEERDWAY